jgi:3-deoxy-D-manno-octulosonate 8-phosphate phosphatase (KDO 8-P phosphatase)
VVYKKVDLDRVRLKAADIHLLVLDVDGVLTDGHLPFDAKGRECKVFHVRDGYGIRRVLEMGIEVALISGRKSVPVKKRADELGIQHVFLGAKDKLATLNKLAEKLGISLSAIACVGDDVPDLECMRAAGLGIAVADAHSDLDAVADWHTHLGGGQGAVREVCDLLLSAHNNADAQ